MNRIPEYLAWYGLSAHARVAYVEHRDCDYYLIVLQCNRAALTAVTLTLLCA